MASRLTKAEKKWIEDLQALLSACPSKRLGFFTIGDPEIFVYDATKERQIIDENEIHEDWDFCRGVEEQKAHLTSIRFPSSVHSTCG